MSQLDVARAALRAVEARVGARPASPDVAWQPAPFGNLGALLEAGRLPRGATSCVTGSNLLLLAALAAECEAASGSWMAVVGAPALGMVAAREAGLDLDRVALVPVPRERADEVAAALVDGIDIVVLGPLARMSPAVQRRLQARARARGAALVVAGERWAGAELTLEVTGQRWGGAREGGGWLRDVELEVLRTGQDGTPRRWTATHRLGEEAWSVAPARARSTVRVA